jgi:uncharacterized protein (TIGR00255 family)
MTGYGRIDTDIFTVQSRSVNHRYLDIHIKTPPYLYYLEPQIRNLIKDEFSRGKISVTITSSSNSSDSIRVNLLFARLLYDALRLLKKELSLEGDIKIDHFLNFKELFTVEEPEVEGDTLLETVTNSLFELKKMREREGILLLEDIKGRITELNNLVNVIDGKKQEFLLSLKKHYMSRISELIDDSAVDEVRLLQEVALIAEKSDITEEVVRIRAHLEHFSTALAEDESSGKKMDFLCQELNREINTIGSKANNADIATIVIHMKSELEKLREQIQNIQ